MFSIISTIVEAIRLGWRHGRLILTLAVLSDIPSTALQFGFQAFIHDSSTSMASRGTYAGVLSLAMMPIYLLVAATVAAAILGVLKSSPSEASVRSTAVESVRRHTWRLFRLLVLLTIIAMFITVPVTLMSTVVTIATGVHHYVPNFLVLLKAILYIVFAKYALADPLVVVESMAPVAALRGSWRMTRGRFWYVLGCYLFLGTAEYLIGSLFRHYESHDRINWVTMINYFISSLIDCVWILLAWCMYVRIKTAEEAPDSAGIDVDAQPIS